MDLREGDLTLREVRALAAEHGYRVYPRAKAAERYALLMDSDPMARTVVTLSTLADVCDWLTE
jgi:hypothetical protein